MNLNKLLLLGAVCCLTMPATRAADDSISADPEDLLKIAEEIAAATHLNAQSVAENPAKDASPETNDDDAEKNAVEEDEEHADVVPEPDLSETVMNSYLPDYPETNIGSIFGGYKNCSNHKWEEVFKDEHQLVIFSCDLPLQFVEASDLPAPVCDQLSAPNFHGTLQAVFDLAAAADDTILPVLSLGYDGNFEPLNPAKTAQALETIASQQDFYAEFQDFAKYEKFRFALHSVLSEYFYSLGVSLPADYRHWYRLNDTFVHIDLDNFKWKRPGEGLLQITLHETSLKDTEITAHLEEQRLDPDGRDALDLLNRKAQELKGVNYSEIVAKPLHYGFSMNAEFIKEITEKILNGQRSGTLNLYPLNNAPAAIEFQLAWDLHKTMLELVQNYRNRAMLKPTPPSAAAEPAEADATTPAPAPAKSATSASATAATAAPAAAAAAPASPATAPQ